MSECMTCRFFVDNEPPFDGECRRFPPLPTTPSGGRSYPVVNRITDWCGEHRFRERMLEKPAAGPYRTEGG